MGLSPLPLAGVPPASNDDLLSMFGSPVPAASARDSTPGELLPDDDILALFKVDGDSAPGVLEQPGEAVPEHDVLGLFTPASEPASGDQGTKTANDDILGLFSAGDSQPGELGGEAAPAKDDPLGLFEVAPQTAPFGQTPVLPDPQEAGASEPDILDMFGIPPAKPEGKEAK
jgi:hypothetical protein